MHTTSRRALLQGAPAAALALAAPAALAAIPDTQICRPAPDDSRLLALVDRAWLAVRHYERLDAIADQTRAAAEADPDYAPLADYAGYMEAALGKPPPQCDPETLRRASRDHTTACKTIWRRHGHDKAWAASNKAHKPAWRAIRRVARMKPATIEGLAAKATLLGYCVPDCNLDAQHEDHQWHQVLARDARRLAKRTGA
jgi:hypothetical protein